MARLWKDFRGATLNPLSIKMQPSVPPHLLLALIRLVLPLPLVLPLAARAQAQSGATATRVTPEKPQHGFRVPFTPVPGQGAPLITVRLNGQLDATFVVDTGTANCLISSALVAKMGLKSYPALLPDGKPLLWYGKQPQAVTLNSLQMGGKSGTLIIQPMNGSLLIVPDQQLRVSADRVVDGMIGVNLLQDFAVAFDFPGQTMTLVSPGDLTPGQGHSLGLDETVGTVLPLSQTPLDLFTAPVRWRNGHVSRQTNLLVDTGSQTTEIPIRDAQALSLFPLRQRPAAGGQGNYMTEEARVDTLGLGNLRIVGPLVTYASPNDVVPRLGMDILSGYKVLLDFPALKMYVQRPSVTAPLVPLKPSASPIPKQP